MCETLCLILYSVVKEEAPEAPDATAAESTPSSSVPEAALSSSALAAVSLAGEGEEATSTSKVVVAECDQASLLSGSGCTSQASVDDDDDVPITDIYFVSPSAHTHAVEHERIIF